MSRKRSTEFSVADLKAQVRHEVNVQRLFDQFAAINVDKCLDVNTRTLESWLVAKYGLQETQKCVTFLKSTTSLPCSARRRLLEKFNPTVVEHFDVLDAVSNVYSICESPSTTVQVLSPPTSKCLVCKSSNTLSVNNQCDVVVFGLRGSFAATKVSTRCQSCRLVYNYSTFGNVADGWRLYEEERDLVEASDVCYVERQMFEMQCSLANHCWVSFSGWSVAYNETIKPLQGFSEKQAASVFWNGELELDLRGANELSFYGLFHKNDDREAVMEEIEKRRAPTVYQHSSADCSEDCKKRGCGKLWVADGLWKIMFSHCAMSTKNVVKGLPLLNYPDVCTAEPQHGKAFCGAHCQFISVHHPEVPTDLRGFLRYCGVLKNEHTNVDDESAAPSTADVSEVEKLKGVVQSLTDDRSSAIGVSVIESQGNASVLTSSNVELSTILDDCIEDQPTTCNKDTGEKQRLQKWSRGHFFIVRGSGFIDKWNPLFRSESPSQAFLCFMEWMLVTLKDIPEPKWNDVFLAYDNMCHVDGMKVTQRPLPFPAPYDTMWFKINKLIDSLHINNHKSEECRTKYNPAKVKEKLPDANTMAGEQTFTWLSRFKKILCSMPKVHHMFYLHRMVTRRNEYTVRCYQVGKKPVLPKARKGTL